MKAFDPCAMLVADGPTSHDIREARRYAAVKFCICLKSGQDFKTCNRVRLSHSVDLVISKVEIEIFCSPKCKGMFYCSRECQKSHWPTHKLHCQPPNAETGTTRLLQNFLSNESLHVYIQVALILRFDLMNKPPELKQPAFDALIDVVIQPTNHLDTIALMDPAEHQNFKGKNIEGMLQVWGIHKRSLFEKVETELTGAEETVWRQTREAFNKNVGGSSEPAGLVRFRDSRTAEQAAAETRIHAMCISPKAMDLVRVMKSITVPKNGVVLPLSLSSCIEFINTSISVDTTNKWMLRMRMRDSDKELLLDPNISLIMKKKLAES